jgi:hypothetical protein
MYNVLYSLHTNQIKELPIHRFRIILDRGTYLFPSGIKLFFAVVIVSAFIPSMYKYYGTQKFNQPKPFTLRDIPTVMIRRKNAAGPGAVTVRFREPHPEQDARDLLVSKIGTYGPSC